jgi:hypothetical protein
MDKRLMLQREKAEELKEKMNTREREREGGAHERQERIKDERIRRGSKKRG